MKSILLVSHGSRSPKTKKEIKSLIQKMRLKSDIEILEYAFLEIENPNIETGIETCISLGASHIRILLNFLNSGLHVNEDIPRIVEKSRQLYPHIKFDISPPIGQHEGIVDLFVSLFSEDNF